MRELEEFFRRQDPVDVAAAAWHTRAEQGLSAGEQSELQRWLAASPVHAAAFGRLDEGVAALRSIPAEKVAQARASFGQASPAAAPLQMDRRPKAAPDSRPGDRETGSGTWSWLGSLLPRPALAAFCCAALVAVGVGWHQWRQPTFTGSYAVERGQRSTVTLPDGSQLAIDADTQAQVTLYRDRREVRIAQGQIMFAVAPDSRKPFDVLAGPARVTVVGTRFSVRYRSTGMDAGAVKVAVEEGRVRVAGKPGDVADRSAASVAAIELSAGQSMTVSPDGAVGAVTAAAPGSVGLWRKGLLRFENTSLADALLELERYGPTGLVIRDPAVAAMTIGGSYPIGRPREFARMVAQVLPVRLVAGPGGETEIAGTR